MQSGAKISLGKRYVKTWIEGQQLLGKVKKSPVLTNKDSLKKCKFFLTVVGFIVGTLYNSKLNNWTTRIKLRKTNGIELESGRGKLY